MNIETAYRWLGPISIVVVGKRSLRKNMNKARDLFSQVTSRLAQVVGQKRTGRVSVSLVKRQKSKKEAGKKAHWKLDAQSLPGD